MGLRINQWEHSHLLQSMNLILFSGHSFNRKQAVTCRTPLYHALPKKKKKKSSLFSGLFSMKFVMLCGEVYGELGDFKTRNMQTGNSI